jgi:hypothetical protein
LKCGKVTVLLLAKASSKVPQLRTDLTKSLNDSNVLNIKDDLAEDDDDIPIPKPSFGDIEEESKEEKKPNAIIDEAAVKIGVPMDKGDLSRGFKDITEESGSLDSVGIKDGSILAFALNDDPFSIQLPDYNDDD